MNVVNKNVEIGVIDTLVFNIQNNVGVETLMVPMVNHQVVRWLVLVILVKNVVENGLILSMLHFLT